jgi:hypothetical protein
VKRLTSLLQYVLADAGTWCRTSADRDLKEITARVEHEGESFLTITLPNFGKEFERALDRGEVSPSSFPGFEKRGRLPLLLGGFVENVFNRDTGVLLDGLLEDNDLSLESEQFVAFINSIRAVRQITLMFSKLNEPTSPRRERRAILDYLMCEEEVRQTDARFLGWLPAGKAEEFSESDARSVWRSLQQSFREDNPGEATSSTWTRFHS